MGGYDQDYEALPRALRDRAEELSLRFNEALGYDMNALEFAVKDGRFYGIDLTNYTPDLDYRSLKDAHFPWAVEKMASFAVEKALSGEPTPAPPDWKTLLLRYGSGSVSEPGEKPREPGAGRGHARRLRLRRRVAQQSQRRLLNRDGSFNVVREGLPFYRSLSPLPRAAHDLLAALLPLVAGGYFAANLVFALLYYLCGPHALDGWHTGNPFDRFEDAFFFSVQTLATIGYGRMSPERPARQPAGHARGAGRAAGLRARHRVAVRALLAAHGADRLQPPTP